MNILFFNALLGILQDRKYCNKRESRLWKSDKNVLFGTVLAMHLFSGQQYNNIRKWLAHMHHKCCLGIIFLIQMDRLLVQHQPCLVISNIVRISWPPPLPYASFFVSCTGGPKSKSVLLHPQTLIGTKNAHKHPRKCVIKQNGSLHFIPPHALNYWFL